ncbi:DUF6319 family protein [Pseudonocardia xishanensis]|uniref:DUF6319 family protein n=1 Tax=Pseudonocardia xishanensis TaxID=630995 RepID=A0ABP8RXE3_9PSEU
MTAPTPDTAAALDSAVPADTARPAVAADGTPVTFSEAAATGEPSPEKRKRGRPKGSTSTARTTRVVELTLTVSGSADGEWQAELKRGASWLARGLPVSVGAVLKAAAELHPEISGPIEEVVAEARAVREAKVAELEAQLEQAKKALAELE